MSERRVRLDHLLGVYAVGSGDWSWQDEHDKLIDQPGTQKLLARIRDEGIREPILLGTDGRVWDGHHRIVIAMHLGLDSVPVEFAGEDGALAVYTAEKQAEAIEAQSRVFHVPTGRRWQRARIQLASGRADARGRGPAPPGASHQPTGQEHDVTFLSYALPKGAPQKQVWYATCDVCKVATSGPYGNGANQQENMRLDIEDKGWRYQREHPMDTCPGCLAHESQDQEPIKFDPPLTDAEADAYWDAISDPTESPGSAQQDRRQ